LHITKVSLFFMHVSSCTDIRNETPSDDKNKYNMWIGKIN
jgi:hypothetical protein